MKWCLTFEEDINPMVLNSTNAKAIAKIAGSEETEDWPGTKIVLFNDPTVEWAGKPIGGIRIRPPKVIPAKPNPTPDDDIQF